MSLGVPHGPIESSNPYHIEILGDPTPDRSIAIDTMAGRAYNKEVGQRWDEWYAVAGQEVPFLHDPDLLCVVFMEERQVDIASHRKRPICVSTHEPEFSMLESSKQLQRMFLHLDEKALNLAQGSCRVLNGRPAYESCNVGQDISYRRIEDESIDRFMEGPRGEESDDDYRTSKQ